MLLINGSNSFIEEASLEEFTGYGYVCHFVSHG